MVNTQEKTQHKRTMATEVDRQLGSMLFQRIPQELRDNIYTHLFASTRLSCGRRYISGFRTVKVYPTPNSLAILQSCRRAKIEIGDEWIGQVLFNFEDPKTMLDKLTTLSKERLSRIRHLRVIGDEFALSHERGDMLHGLPCAFKLLPGLRLDVLTVLGTPIPRYSHDALNSLIKESSGWKKLCFINHDSKILAFAKCYHRTDDEHLGKYKYRRNPQPRYWQSILEFRDGAASRPSVKMYRSLAPNSMGTILDRSKRKEFEQKVPEDGEGQKGFGLQEDRELMVNGEFNKEVLIIAERGIGIDFEEKENSPYVENDIRREMPGKTWNEIKRECERNSKDRGYYSMEDEADEFVWVDLYNDVDEYMWPWSLVRGS